MNSDYIAEVRRFGGDKPFANSSGGSRNLDHQTDIDPSRVSTDGRGNVTEMPLLRRKPCFGRLERFLRGPLEGKAWYDKDGARNINDTQCDRCRTQSAGVFEACETVSNERLSSSAAIEHAVELWFDALGDASGPTCFKGTHSGRWFDVLDAIEGHGGWSNVNDAQVKVAEIAAEEAEKERRREREKMRRARERDRLRSLGQPITDDMRGRILVERSRRAALLKSLVKNPEIKSASNRWLWSLSDESCERVADVWAVKTALLRLHSTCTGTQIAEVMLKNPRYLLKNKGTLEAHISRDLDRIEKLERTTAAGAVWGEWSWSE